MSQPVGYHAGPRLRVSGTVHVVAWAYREDSYEG